MGNTAVCTVLCKYSIRKLEVAESLATSPHVNSSMTVLLTAFKQLWTGLTQSNPVHSGVSPIESKEDEGFNLAS